jgi:hypothetical protein
LSGGPSSAAREPRLSRVEHDSTTEHLGISTPAKIEELSLCLVASSLSLERGKVTDERCELPYI